MTKSLVAILSAVLFVNLCYVGEGAQHRRMRDLQTTKNSSTTIQTERQRTQRRRSHDIAMPRIRNFANRFRNQIDNAPQIGIPRGDIPGSISFIEEEEPSVFLGISEEHERENVNFPTAPPSTPQLLPLFSRILPSIVSSIPVETSTHRKDKNLAEQTRDEIILPVLTHRNCVKVEDLLGCDESTDTR